MNCRIAFVGTAGTVWRGLRVEANDFRGWSANDVARLAFGDLLQQRGYDVGALYITTDDESRVVDVIPHHMITDSEWDTIEHDVYGWIYETVWLDDADVDESEAYASMTPDETEVVDDDDYDDDRIGDYYTLEMPDLITDERWEREWEKNNNG